ncbi:MAG: TolC family protein [Candidatus Aminicenantales bacterium]
MTHRLWRIVSLGLIVTFFWGCVRYQPKPVSAARVLEDFEARRLDAPELKNHLFAARVVSEWPPASWDLKALTLAALYYHPDLDVARAQWGAALAGRISAGERPNPTVTPMIGYNSTTLVSEITPWIPEIALQIPIETAGKRGIRISEARHLSEAARWSIFSVAWDVRSRVRQGLLDLYTAQETETLQTKLLDIQSENVRLLELQFGVGEVAAFDVTQARIALANNRLAALETSKQKAQARIRLADALGVPAVALDGFKLSFDIFEHPPSEIPQRDAGRQALLNRSDILGALSEYAASQAALQLEIAKQYPDINIGPGWQLDQTDHKWTLGLSLVLPIFSRNKGPIAEAEARRTESAARFLTLQAKALGDLDVAIAASRAAVQNAKIADELFAFLKKQEESAKTRWQLGDISKLEWLGLQLELGSSALARLDALIKVQEAVGQLETAMQSPLDKAEWILDTPRRDSGEKKERDDE